MELEMSTNRFAETTRSRWEIHKIIRKGDSARNVFFTFNSWLLLFLVLQSMLCWLSRHKWCQEQKLHRLFLHRWTGYNSQKRSLHGWLQQFVFLPHHPFHHDDSVLLDNETILEHDHGICGPPGRRLRICCADGRTENTRYHSRPHHFGWVMNLFLF